jgi:hypothetical protein
LGQEGWVDGIISQRDGVHEESLGESFSMDDLFASDKSLRRNDSAQSLSQMDEDFILLSLSGDEDV